MTVSFLYRAFCRVLQLIRLSGRKDTDLAIEVVMLRHEVTVLRRQIHRPALQRADWAVLCALWRLVARSRKDRWFVQPATLLRWHRDLVAKRWTYPHDRPGRPPLPAGTAALVLRLATENPAWGYRRIQGELATMGIPIAASSVWAILKRGGIEPSRRRSGPTWAEFLAAQAKGLMSGDFFSVDTVALRRLHVLFCIQPDTRTVRIAGVTAKPAAHWVTQQARNLSMALPDQAAAVKFLIRDRDSKFRGSFDAVFAAEGLGIIKTPVRAPRAKRHGRAVRQHRPARVPRPDTHPRMAPPPSRARPVRPALPLAPSPPVPQPAPTIQGRHHSQPDRQPQRRTSPTVRRPGRPHPPVPTRRVNWADEFSAPTGQVSVSDPDTVAIDRQLLTAHRMTSLCHGPTVRFETTMCSIPGSVTSLATSESAASRL